MRMKRVLCVALAATLLGTTAASADGWHHGGRFFGHGGDGAALGIGLGILTLGILAAESHRPYYRDDGYYGGSGAYDDRYGDGYDNGYPDANRERGYNGYNNGDGYPDADRDSDGSDNGYGYGPRGDNGYSDDNGYSGDNGYAPPDDNGYSGDNGYGPRDDNGDRGPGGDDN